MRDATQHTALVLGFGLNRCATLLASYSAFGLILGNQGFVTSVDFMLAKAFFGSVIAFFSVFFILKGKAHCQNISALLPTILFVALFVGGMLAPRSLVDESCFRILLGAGSGVVSSLFSLIWFEQLLRGPFIKDLVGGCLLSAIVLFFGQQLPTSGMFAVSIFCIVVSYICLIRMRAAIPFDNYPVLVSIKKENPLKDIFSRDYIQALLCVLVCIFVVGTMHTAVLDSESVGIISDVNMGLVAIVSCLILALFIYFAAGVPNPLLVYKICLPIMLIIFSLMPFTAHLLGSYAGFIMNVCYSVIAIAFMAFALEYSWKQEQFDCANYGVYLFSSNFVLFIGLIVGLILNSLSSAQGVSIFMLLAFVAIYPLGIVLLLILTRLSSSDKKDSPSVQEKAFSETIIETESLRFNRFAEKYSFTKREKEVCSFLLKRRAVKHIANTLYLSENTVWTHIKGIYSKTNVHSKEELIDLFEETYKQEREEY